MLVIGSIRLTVVDLWTVLLPHEAMQYFPEPRSINGYCEGWLTGKVVLAVLETFTQQYDGVNYAYYTLADIKEGRPNTTLEWAGESFSNITMIFVLFIVSKSHWNLLVLHKTTEIRFYFEPLAGNFERVISPSTDPSLASQIDEISKVADTKTGWRSRKWRCIEPMHYPQKDNYNCGPLICHFARCLCEGSSLVAEFDGKAERARIMSMLFRFCYSDIFERKINVCKVCHNDDGKAQLKCQRCGQCFHASCVKVDSSNAPFACPG